MLSGRFQWTLNRDAELQFPGLHDSDLYEVLPTPIGEKPLNWKQSYKVELLSDVKIYNSKFCFLQVAQWKRNAVMRERKREGYFATYDHKHLRRDPSHNWR